MGLGTVALVSLGLLGQTPLPGPTPSILPPPIAAATTSTIATPAMPAAALTKADLDAWLDGYLPYALHSGDIAGAVVSVVKDGQVLTLRGYGYADVRKRIPADPEKTLFRPGSVSKLVTWTAVMQLVEQHKLDLDRDVNDYLDFTIPPWHGQPVTLRQIMTHSAGFEDAVKNLLSFDTRHVTPIDAYLKAWIPARIFAPGSTPGYSNWATTLAGYIVQRVSHLPFDDYVEQRIFSPLGMHSSTFRQPLPDRLRGQMAVGYGLASQPGHGFEVVVPAPAGALSSTAADMARFMIAHLQGGTLDGARILAPQTASTMHASPLDHIDKLSLLPPLNRMELGFFETNANGHEVIGHLGDTDYFHTSLHLFINDGVGLYVSFNSVGRDGAVQTLRTALFHDFADRYFPAPARPAAEVPKDVAARHAAMMAGHWTASRRSEGNFLAIVGLLGQAGVSTDAAGHLVVSDILQPGGAPRHWEEVTPFVWQDIDGYDRLAAKVENGRVVRWSWDLMSPFEVMLPVPASRNAGWILPALAAALVVLLLSFLAWPAGWLIRRYHGVASGLAGSRLHVARATKLTSLLAVAVPVGWGLLILKMLSDDTAFSSASDPALWALQIGGMVFLVGAVLLSACNAVLTWQDRSGWLARAWSLLLVPSTLLLLYVAYSFGLLAMTVRY